MEQTQVVSDRVGRIKGLLRSEGAAGPGQERANYYPNPASLNLAQVAEIQASYEAAQAVPIGLRLRPHVILALALYRFGFNPHNAYNAVPLAEWVLTSFWQAYPQYAPKRKRDLTPSKPGQ